MTKNERALHEAGHAARLKGSPKRPPLLTWAERRWWLAGWNQADLDWKADSRSAA